MNRNKQKPNVIWIFGDQHRAQALSCNGNPNVRTPNIDTLAATGVNFDRAVSGYPLCCPYRGSLLTGKYPHKSVPKHESQLPPDQPTIANVLNDSGYDTAYFGKWHLDGFHEGNGRAAHHIIPPERRGGFKRWVGYENNNSPLDCWVHGGEGEDAFHYRLPGYETNELTHLFIDYLDEKGREKASGNDEPFFAVLSVQAPHDPYYAPANSMANHPPAHIQLRENVPDIPRIKEPAKKDLAGYYASIENLDWNVGRIREALFEAGLAFDTHIIFFSDHGDMHGSHGQSRKTSPYEESIRVPFIISGEQPHYNGRQNGNVPALVNHVDISATTLGLCGIAKPSWMKGTDYAHYRLGGERKACEPDSAYLQNLDPRDNIDRPWRGIVTDDGWKYVCLEGGIPYLMFNLKEDPYESVNLIFDRHFIEQRKHLNECLRQWIKETDDYFQLPVY